MKIIISFFLATLALVFSVSSTEARLTRLLADQPESGIEAIETEQEVQRQLINSLMEMTDAAVERKLFMEMAGALDAQSDTASTTTEDLSDGGNDNNNRELFACGLSTCDNDSDCPSFCGHCTSGLFQRYCER